MQRVVVAKKAQSFIWSFGTGPGQDSGANGNYPTPIMLPIGSIVTYVIINGIIGVTPTGTVLYLGWEDGSSAAGKQLISGLNMGFEIPTSTPQVLGGDPNTLWAFTSSMNLQVNSNATVILGLQNNPVTAGAFQVIIEYY